MVQEPRDGWSPWRSIVAFGLVSLSADMVYEGMRSVAGPFLGSLGASALTVGAVTGAGEAIALGLRLLAGSWADRSGRHWQLTSGGYALTAVCVPLLAITPFLGAAGLGVASVLILAERTGKAIRSPSKSALLAAMTLRVGRGRGFAVHKSLDQVGAFAGPLLVAGVAAVTGHIWVAFAVLAVPGAVSLWLLSQLRRSAPIEEPTPVTATVEAGSRLFSSVRALPRRFHLFSASCALGTLGLMTFGVISFAAVSHGLVRPSVVPVMYAGAMAVEAFAALGTGFAFDRVGPRVLFVLPVLVAMVPALAFTTQIGWVLAGLGFWGLATGVQDSTVKALVADLVPAGRLATAYGVFAAVQGVGALVGGVTAGALYRSHLSILVVTIGVLQVASLILLAVALRPPRGDPQPG